MKDLSRGSILVHLVTMALPLVVSSFAQIMYQLVDLYFLTQIDVETTAGASAAGTASLVVISISQVLQVGTVVLVAHAVGRKDRAEANLIVNQAFVLSIVCGLVMIGLIHVCTRFFLQSIMADPVTLAAGATYILWMLPGYASMLLMTVLASALRGTGTVRAAVAVQVGTVILNAILAPILIAGLGTGVALGVRGAGLATSISVVSGTVALGWCLHVSQGYIVMQRTLMRPMLNEWRRILTIGGPAGADIVLFFFSIYLFTTRSRNLVLLRKQDMASALG